MVLNNLFYFFIRISIYTDTEHELNDQFSLQIIIDFHRSYSSLYCNSDEHNRVGYLLYFDFTNIKIKCCNEALNKL